MTTHQTETDITSSYFIQKHSLGLRIWHWLTFFLLIGTMLTVLLNSTLMNPRKNVNMVQEQLQSKGLKASESQAFAVSHEYEDKIWGVHKAIGYCLAILLISRGVIELTHRREEKLKTRIREALGFYRKNDENKKVYRHYLGVKLGYLIFYLLLLCMAITGLSLAFGKELGIQRPLHNTIKEIHSFGQYLMYAFVFFHLSGVVLAENRKMRGIVSGMINGN